MHLLDEGEEHLEILDDGLVGDVWDMEWGSDNDPAIQEAATAQLDDGANAMQELEVA